MAITVSVIMFIAIFVLLPAMFVFLTIPIMFKIKNNFENQRHEEKKKQLELKILEEKLTNEILYNNKQTNKQEERK